MKAVPVIHQDILEIPPNTPEKDYDNLPTIAQARDWTISSEGVQLEGTAFPPTLKHWMDAIQETTLRVHHHQEWQNDQLIRDEWYVATPEWVKAYHRSGGMWSYND